MAGDNCIATTDFEMRILRSQNFAWHWPAIMRKRIKNVNKMHFAGFELLSSVYCCLHLAAATAAALIINYHKMELNRFII